MPDPYEVILVYDGENTEYVDRLLDIYDFDYIVMNPKRGVHRFALINRGWDACTGNYFMHVENDYYWSHPGSVRRAFEAFEKVPDLDFVRFEFLPFWRSKCEQVVKLSDDELCIVPKNTSYRWNLNPHLRKTKFPAGRLLEKFPPRAQPEKTYADEYNKYDYVAGCLTGENFRHIGIYDEGGHFKQFYAERFTLVPDQREFDAWAEFQKFCDNQQYQQLFRSYLDKNGGRQLVIIAFDGLDYNIIKEKAPELRQFAHGRTSLDNHIEKGGTPRGATNEIFSTFLTGTTPDIHGVKFPLDYEFSLKGKQPTFLELVDSVAVDVPCYNTHPNMKKFHRRCDWAFGFDAHRQQLGMTEEEYWPRVQASRDALERDLLDYLYTIKLNRVKKALDMNKQLTMIYFWFTDIIGHMGYKENDDRIDRLYDHVRHVFKKLKEVVGDRPIMVMSDHGMKRGGHNPRGAFWSFSDSVLSTNYTPQMEEWYNILKRWLT